MDDRKCPHLEVKYFPQRQHDTKSGKLNLTQPGWRCVWCEQEFIPVPQDKTEGKKK